MVWIVRADCLSGLLSLHVVGLPLDAVLSAVRLEAVGAADQ